MGLSVKFSLNTLFLLIVLCTGCSEQNTQQTVKIAINPWPGYEFLFLAQEKGFFKQLDLDIKLLEMPSLADVLRVYNHGHADGMASTMIETVLAADNTQSPINLVLIPDYSFGGDIIIATDNIKDLKGLKGKRIGAEIGSLGMYILAQALAKHGLGLKDVDIINVEQLDAQSTLKAQQIDALVTYPPFSTKLLKMGGLHEIFTTKELPGDVIDTVSIRSEILESLPQDWSQRFYKAWDMALTYSQENPKEAYAIMAQREGITPAEFADALTGLKLLTSSESQEALKQSAEKNIKKVCETLTHSQSVSSSCDVLSSLVKTAR